MSGASNKVIANQAQNFNDTEKGQARANIDAIKGAIRQHTQGAVSETTAKELVIDQDFTEVSLGIGSDEVSLGYLAPHRPAGSTGDMTLHLPAGQSNPVWGEATTGVFVAVYTGSSSTNTPYADIKTAFDAGKAVFMTYTLLSGNVWYSLDQIDSTQAIFSRTVGSLDAQSNYGNVTNNICIVKASDNSYTFKNASLVYTAGNGIDITNNIITSNVFEVTYGITTLAQIDTAIAAHRIPILRISSGRFATMSRYISGTSAWFSTISMEGNLLTAGVQHYAVNSNGWYTDPQSMNGNDQIMLPSVQTVRVTTTSQDTIDPWITIGSVIIGGHGVSGGGIDIRIKSALSGAKNFYYDTTFRTNAQLDSALDNSTTYGDLTINSTTWTPIYLISQYSGTNTVSCMLDLWLYDKDSNTPSIYHIKIRKLYDGYATKLYISATENWGDPD